MHVKGIMYKQTIMYFVNPRMTSGITKGNNDHHHEQQQEAAPVGLASLAGASAGMSESFITYVSSDMLAL